jgi:hypothetical protein
MPQTAKVPVRHKHIVLRMLMGNRLKIDQAMAALVQIKAELQAGRCEKLQPIEEDRPVIVEARPPIEPPFGDPAETLRLERALRFLPGDKRAGRKQVA